MDQHKNGSGLLEGDMPGPISQIFFRASHIALGRLHSFLGLVVPLVPEAHEVARFPLNFVLVSFVPSNRGGALLPYGFYHF